mmetsp:Transcript_90823/g.166695  ORF Transcript_90823/g.166695 Transcript_90823/m.166695 type:complete len:318 (-) Transcript_90823:251-1204(-)
MTESGDLPNTNIFIGDLPTDLTEDQLKEIFGTYGAIASTKLITGSGKSGKNAMLVRFIELTDAVWIKENLNGNIPQGLTTPVYVNYNNRTGKGKGKDGGKDGGKWGGPYSGDGGGKGWWGSPAELAMASWGGKGKGSKGFQNIFSLKEGLIEAGSLPEGKWQTDMHAVYVHGLPNDTSDIDLYHIFSPFGAIPAYGCRAMMNDDGSCKGFGFVNFIDAISAEMAIMSLNGTQLPNGKTLTVSMKQAKATSQPQQVAPKMVQNEPQMTMGMPEMMPEMTPSGDGGMENAALQYGEALLMEMQPSHEEFSIPAAFQKKK